MSKELKDKAIESYIYSGMEFFEKNDLSKIDFLNALMTGYINISQMHKIEKKYAIEILSQAWDEVDKIRKEKEKDA